VTAVVWPLQRCIARHQRRRLVAGAQQLSRSPVSPAGAAWQTQIGKRSWGSPISTKITPIHALGPSMAVAGRTTRRKSPSSWPSAHALLARGSGRALEAGASGVIDRCGHWRWSWWDNGPRHFAESRHHELLGRAHGTRLLSWTSSEVGWKEGPVLGGLLPGR
jgi:hypothetical protein